MWGIYLIGDGWLVCFFGGDLSLAHLLGMIIYQWASKLGKLKEPGRQIIFQAPFWGFQRLEVLLNMPCFVYSKVPFVFSWAEHNRMRIYFELTYHDLPLKVSLQSVIVSDSDIICREQGWCVVLGIMFGVPAQPHHLFTLIIQTGMSRFVL
mgnify:CR=1 FL=1